MSSLIRALSVFVALLALAALATGCGGDVDGTPDSGPALPDGGGDAASDDAALDGFVPDGGSDATDDGGADDGHVDDGGADADVGDDGGLGDGGMDDGGLDPLRILSTELGVLDEAGSRVHAVPYGLYIEALLDALEISEGATATVHGTTTVILDPETTPIEPGMRITLTRPGDAPRDYAIELETLTNTAVLLLGGQAIRISTRYFTQASGEIIILDTQGFSHFCMTPDIVSGTHGPNDLDGPAACFELIDYGEDGLTMGNVTFDDLQMVLEIGETAISGRMEGVLRNSETEREVVGWFHSDRVESGSW